MDIKYLKAQRTRLLNKPCGNIEEFEEVQAKLNAIEMLMREVKNERSEG